MAISAVSAGVLPAAVVAPYASSYNAHSINHAIAAPVAAAPLVAAPAQYVAAAAPAPYVAAASAPYVAAASPYVASPYFSPSYSYVF